MRFLIEEIAWCHDAGCRAKMGSIKILGRSRWADSDPLHQSITHDGRLMGAAGRGSPWLSQGRAWAQNDDRSPTARGGPGAREITTAFPQKKGADDPAADPVPAAPGKRRFEVFRQGRIHPQRSILCAPGNWALIPTENRLSTNSP